MIKKVQQREYGDFQTPFLLAEAIVTLLRYSGIRPQAILEPTCGKGAFLLAAINAFPEVTHLVGVEINKQYVHELEQRISSFKQSQVIEVMRGDFFNFDWQKLLCELPDPVLIIGNPPWVTNSELGRLMSVNLPQKSNVQGHCGYEAITGKSNFDVSEWMILQHLHWLKGRQGTIALLCKTSVARKILLHIWKQQLSVSATKIFLIDAQKHFNVSVDACLFVIDLSTESTSFECAVFSDFNSEVTQIIGYHNGTVLANVEAYQKWSHLDGLDQFYTWRSGIKHDCSKVMELERDGNGYRNGFGEWFQLEDQYIYPLLKSSDIGAKEVSYGRKYLLVTQTHTGEETSIIKKLAPKTWAYLQKYSNLLAKRASSIYLNRPSYSIFGVGDYTFSPWKVAISGFYKNLRFQLIEPFHGKPAVLDDTTYFLSCWSKIEAMFILNILNSKPATAFLESMIFWADKRPITIDILKHLNLHALSVELKSEAQYLELTAQRKDQGQRNYQFSLEIA